MNIECKKTILLVEDEITFATMEKQQLEKKGYNVILAQKANEAIDIVHRQNKNINLILIDILLDDVLDGTDVAKEIIKNYNIPILFLSAHTEREIVEKTEKIPSYGYVVKDSNINVLDASIKMAFKLFDAKKKLREELEERKKNEKEIIRLNRLYSVTNKINQMIVRAKDKEEIFKDICKIAIDYGNFRMAWIGLVDETEEVVKPFTWAGFEDGYLSKIKKISIKDVPEGRGPTGTAIREGKFFCNNDLENASFMSPWRNEAMERGYKSSIALPIKINNEVIGAFTIYASEKDFFNQQEINLLLDMTSSISYSLEMLDHEELRKEAEDEIIKLNIELEKRVNQRTLELESAYKDLEAFSYSVSHDLRAPLRHITGFVDILNKNIYHTLDEKNKTYLKIIYNSATKMKDLIDAILSFSRLGRTMLSKTNVNVDVLVKEVLELFEVDIKNRQIEIKINNLPHIMADYNLLKTVYINLISNAIKFTSKKDFTLIEIGSEDNNNEYIFYVKDNGSGFDMSYKDKLFMLFQRLHSDNDFEGTGLGLANINKIIQKHGGKTWAIGKVDNGATFYFTLPKL